MVTLGIDLASQAADTAVCLLDWAADRVGIQDLTVGCSDTNLDALIARADAIGIDAPFGWPIAFAGAVAGWSHTTWTIELRDRLRFRETDRAVHIRTGRWPLSVSTDRIALPAMRAMALLHRHGITDKSGADRRFFEIYPAGSLISWGFSAKGYKGRLDAATAPRTTILHALRQRLPTLDIPDSCAGSDHAIDSLIASLTARCAALGFTHLPAPDQVASAQREGWIHIPTAFPVT